MPIDVAVLMDSTDDAARYDVGSDAILHLYSSVFALIEASRLIRFRVIMTRARDVAGVMTGEPLGRALSGVVAPPLIIFQTARLPTPADARSIVALSLARLLVHPVFTAVDSIDPALNRALGACQSDNACAAVLTSVQHELATLPISARPLLTGVILRGFPRTSVSALATSWSMNVRSLERMFALARLPAMSRLLNWSCCVQCAWYLDVLGWTRKRVAVAAGFASPQAFANFTMRNIGRSPSQLCVGGFGQLIVEFIEMWRSRTSPATADD